MKFMVKLLKVVYKLVCFLRCRIDHPALYMDMGKYQDLYSVYGAKLVVLLVLSHGHCDYLLVHILSVHLCIYALWD